MFDFNIITPERKESDFPKEASEPPLLAKSGKNSVLLSKHLIEVAEFTDVLLDQLVLPEEEVDNLRKIGFLAGLFHDLGKAAIGFQAMLKNENIKRWPQERGGYRHEVLSSVIASFNIKTNAFLTELEKQIIIFSILAHHKSYYKNVNEKGLKTIPEEQFPGMGSFKLMMNELKINEGILDECWKEMKNNTHVRKLIQQEILPEKLILPDELDNKIILPKGYVNGQYKSLILESYSIKEKRILGQARALLTVSDHLASSGRDKLSSVPKLANYPILKGNDEFRPFQKKCDNHQRVLILQAPTGSGKTEAAFVWMAKNQEIVNLSNKIKLGRAYYILPYRASINAMYNRFKNWLQLSTDNEVIGLLHSGASYVYYSMLEEEMYEKLNQEKSMQTINEKEIGYTAKELSRLLREVFFPIKIATPHQLLKGILQGKGWENVLYDFYKTVFVFDEIHAYDPRITGLIIGLAKVLLSDVYSAKIMFMTATLPLFLKEKLIQELNIPDLNIIKPKLSKVEDRKILEKKRHKIKVVDEKIEELLIKDEIELTNFESVLIVVNTVNLAQNIYNKLKEKINKEKLLLIHSRFTLKDRKDKENILELLFGKNKNIEKIPEEYRKVTIVIATQVVEVSLDVDFEIGIFDGAPIDPLVQRMGRVNRYGKRTEKLKDWNILIMEPSKYTKLLYKDEITKITLKYLRDIKEIVSETELVEIIDKIYSEKPWGRKEQEDYERAINSVLIKEYEKKLVPGSYRHWVDDVIEENNTIEAIWENHEKEYAKIKKDNAVKALEYMLQVRVKPEWKKEGYIIEKKYFPLILSAKKFDYDKELGLRYKI